MVTVVKDNLEDIRKALAKGPVKVVFFKKDGSIRELYGTTSSEYFDYDKKLSGDAAKEMEKKDAKVGLIRVFDLQKGEFRSFKIDSIIEWKRYKGKIPSLK